MSADRETACWVALSTLHRVGGKTLAALLDRFGSAQAVMRASETELQQVHGVGNKIASAIRALDVEAIQFAIPQWNNENIAIYLSHDPLYPPLLRTIDDPPPTLFAHGTCPIQQWHQTVALVGTRRPSNQACIAAYRLGATLVEQGWTIVSGLALGVDSYAHEGALAHATGHTLAVLGSGVHNIYPPNHKELAARIRERGALISENLPHAEPNPSRLVSRNRIISGLSQHVIIVESAADGGAMYAARAAQQQGRHVYAVDLPASGNQALLREGATPIPRDEYDFVLPA